MILYNKWVLQITILINATYLGFMVSDVISKNNAAVILSVGDYAKIVAPILTLIALFYELFINKEREKRS